ncbi:hypothetical protein J3459_012132 [Metarhizium acridum]|nr:hypothetical protein J3459_012132 [Metarhizium acridum]
MTDASGDKYPGATRYLCLLDRPGVFGLKYLGRCESHHLAHVSVARWSYYNPATVVGFLHDLEDTIKAARPSTALILTLNRFQSKLTKPDCTDSVSLHPSQKPATEPEE